MRKHLLLLSIGLVIVVLLVWLPMGGTQMPLPALQEKVLSPGVYLLQVDKPLKVPAHWKVQSLKVIGQDYKHKECGGDVKRSNEITDKGTTLLKCKKCGREWVVKVGEPR